MHDDREWTIKVLDSKLYLSGIEIREIISRVVRSLSPNCTLVELKYDFRRLAKDGRTDSKLYLSGIEIVDLRQVFLGRWPPNCTLVELK
mgnify:CR=1 FL=1